MGQALPPANRGLESRVGRRKRLPHVFHEVSRAEGPSQQGVFMRVEDEYLDVLQNLEWAIVNEFRQDRSILDLDARAAANALVRHYEAEAESRGAPGAPLSDRARRNSCCASSAFASRLIFGPRKAAVRGTSISLPSTWADRRVGDAHVLRRR